MPGAFRPSIKKIKLHSGLEIELSPNSVLMVVGPNNGGKSTFLNDLSNHLFVHNKLLWVMELDWDRGSDGQFSRFVDSYFTPGEHPQTLRTVLGGDVHESFLASFRSNNRIPAKVGHFLIRTLNAHERVKSADAVRAVRRAAETLGKSWALKKAGMSLVPSGELHIKIEVALAALLEAGILVLPNGELENFDRRTSSHGQRWVQATIEKGPLQKGPAGQLEELFKLVTQ